jgi:hypothetical protein
MNERATTENEAVPRHCANETCPREAETGERYCADCGLERALFLRDRREDPAAILADASERGPGR